MGSIKVCIIIPMYNEERVASLSVKTILQYTGKLPSLVTLLVVNDGSKDRTEQIVREVAGRHRPDVFTVITHPANKGYGAALKTGVRYAVDHRYEYALFMDSDLTNHPKYLTDFHKKMCEGWDYIKATRYAKGGCAKGVPWRHRVISIVGNTIARNLYGLPLTDITNGFRAVKVDVLKQMDLRENDFSIIVEELSRAKQLTKSFCEIPYVLTSRRLGQGTTHFCFGTCMRYLRHALNSRFQ